jgi:phosphopantetheinyl transferase
LIWSTFAFDLAELQIAKQFFSSQEVAVLCALPVEQQTKAFFNCWTRKEAYIRLEAKAFRLRSISLMFSSLPESRRRFSTIEVTLEKFLAGLYRN